MSDGEAHASHLAAQTLANMVIAIRVAYLDHSGLCPRIQCALMALPIECSFPYFFPLSPILLVVLQKVKLSGNTFLGIAPLWPHQSWYPNLISLSVHHPLCRPQREDLLVQDRPKRFWVHPTRVCSNTALGCCPGAPPNSRFFGENCGPSLPCLRETAQDASTMPSGRSFVGGEHGQEQVIVP